MTTETSAVFNMATQFGGGKTHALTLLYHLAQNGPKASEWKGVPGILKKAGVERAPQCRPAVFVGQEFDSIAGRGGDDGTPLRKTPWGEIAFQIGGKKAFELAAEHDRQFIAPGGDVLDKLLPDKEPCLILMDELMNYVSRFRKMGMATQLYNFLQNLSEAARASPRVAQRLTWTGEAPWQKWMNFYNRVLTRFATSRGLKLTLTVEAAPEGGVSSQQIEETRVALRELGLDDKVRTE